MGLRKSLAQKFGGHPELPQLVMDTMLIRLTRSVVDESMKMPDIATVAAMHVLRSRGIDGGASTALNFLVSLYRAYQLKLVHN
ncbi:hypothetical protein ANCDUO_11863 [Ancylostoma duodenale]|uniref:Uncharacterized protein n=1 Tax=Ancylostoma duodenale TaxID=51022 RepID=A0A0C2GAD7_9BILA|nr:hypothetical protein ANCDUO_11863 [Ancylostoma duodenale]